MPTLWCGLRATTPRARTFGGFCYFNNAAIAANMLARYGKVAILDVDYHHGNGQQEIFYARSDVLTVSIHGHPSFAYPYFTGFRDETGIGAGAGFNLNIPLPEHLTPEQHRSAVAEGLRRIRRFRPTFLVVSLGLDTARGDPTGTWSNRARDFEQSRTYDRRAGLSHARGAGGRLPRAHARLERAPLLCRTCRPVTPRRGRWRRRSREAMAVQKPVIAMGSIGGTASWPTTSAACARWSRAPACSARLEVDIAGELVTERLTKGIRSGYHFVLAERGPALVGLCLLRADRGDAGLVRSLLDCRVAGRAAEGSRRAGL